MLTGKTHETFFHTAVLSLRLHKGESPFGLKALNIYHFQTSSHQLTCHRRIERIPKASEFSKNNLILSVLPSCNNTFNCDSLIWCFAKAPSKTSSVPEPFSRSTTGKAQKLFQRQFVISSQLRPYMSDNH